MDKRDILPILMLVALPAAGKSSILKYLNSLSKEELKEKYHIGDVSIQIDDFVYVDLMYKITKYVKNKFNENIYFVSGYEADILATLMGDDYLDIKKCNPEIPEKFLQDPSEWFFNRFDNACVKFGHLPRHFSNLKLKYGEEKYNELKKDCQSFCEKVLIEKYNQIPKSIEDKTIVFEFSRGGPKGATFPFKEPMGYQYTFSLFDEEILKNVAVLYVWVTPEQSFKINLLRGEEEKQKKDEKDSGEFRISHVVDPVVMEEFYSSDDIDYLINLSPKRNYLPIIKDGKEFKVKCGRVDNRENLTRDFRKSKEEWNNELVEKMERELIAAFDNLV